MLVMIGLFLLSMVPCVALFLWLRNQKGMQEGYPRACDKALINGVLTVFLVMAGSATLHVIGSVLDIGGGNELIWQAYYKFVVIALTEELCKFYMMWRIVRKDDYSFLAVTAFMVLVGIGFEMAEAIPYAIGSGPGPMFMRGFTMMHPAFGFIMGYFYAKSLKEGKKGYAVLGILLPWLIHGLYDFCLSEVMLDMEWPGYLALGLAAFSVVLILLFIRFVIKSRKDEERTLPMGQLKGPEPAEETAEQ